MISGSIYLHWILKFHRQPIFSFWLFFIKKLPVVHYIFISSNFSVRTDARVFFKRKLDYFFTMKTLKKWPQNQNTYGRMDFFFTAAPTAQNLSKNENSYWKFVSRHICSLICGTHGIPRKYGFSNLRWWIKFFFVHGPADLSLGAVFILHKGVFDLFQNSHPPL